MYNRIEDHIPGLNRTKRTFSLLEVDNFGRSTHVMFIEAFTEMHALMEAAKLGYNLDDPATKYSLIAD